MYVRVPLEESVATALMSLVDSEGHRMKVSAAHDDVATQILYVSWFGKGGRRAHVVYDGKRKVTLKATGVRASAVTEALSGFDWAGSEGIATYFFADSP